MKISKESLCGLRLTRVYADLSTAHMTLKDRDLLEAAAENPSAPLTVYNYKYGFFIPLDSDSWEETKPELEEAGHSEDFVFLLGWCIKQAFDLMRFDCDGEISTRFPTHDW